MFNFSIIEFLEDREIEWANENGVSFVVLPEDKNGTGILIEASYPGFTLKDTTELDISVEFDNEALLYKEFPFHCEEDVLGFPIVALAAAYTRGLATIACYVDTADGIGLEFRKIDNTLFASDEGTQESHEVLDELIQPEDFVAYTRAYFGKRQ